ncbi:MAG: hypothetical protein O2821_13375 [Chloroflexi bacterium]|nr:hypothetical protein [Chloroflexota bacterium]MDA1228924.1 hypothetical protein [Chloroflexota bacterium]
MRSPITLSILRQDGRAGAAKVRLTICLALFGASLGASGMLISFLARTRFPLDPTHLDFQATILLTPSGAIAGAVLGSLLTWPTTNNDGRSHGLVLWLIMGFMFGVLLSFVTGLFMPYSTAVLNTAKGVSEASDFMRDLVDAAFRMPSVAVIQGVFGLFTGMLMGAFFMLGGMLIERFNTSPNPRISRYAPYVIAVGLAVFFVALGAYGPADLLAKLG